jgi:predicted aminopeptidase
MKTMKLLFFVLLLPSLNGCGNLLYLSHLGWYQAGMTFRSLPIEMVLEDEDVSLDLKEKIRFIQEVKRHGEEKLDLKKTKNYLNYVTVDGPVLYVVTACEKDRLNLVTWTFPLTGEVDYKSFFTQGRVLKEERSLEKKGYDTFVQEVAAYSTLGWMKDPIFSSMLEWEKATLASVILHEMTHATIYFKGETDFNEQMATFVGNRGAIDFLLGKYGPGSREVRGAIQSQEDDLLFSHWIGQAYRQLSEFYERAGSKEEKIRGREPIFQSLKESFQEVKARFKTNGYMEFERVEINNAVLVAYRRYVHQLERFDLLYDYFGKDLRKVVQLFKDIRESKEEPSPFLERWMKERGIDFSSPK